MSALGWIFMLTSCGTVTLLTAYCYYRVLTTPRTDEHLHAPLEIDTHDRGT